MLDQKTIQFWLSKLQPDRPFSLGIDRGTHAIRYVLVHHVRREILEWGVFPTQGGDPGKGKQQLVLILKEITKKLSEQKIGSVAINIQGNSVMAGKVQTAHDEKSDQAALIRLALRNQLSAAIEDVVYYCREYRNLGSQDHPTFDRKHNFNFIAVDKHVLLGILEPFTEIFSVSPQMTTQGYALESLIEDFNLAAPGKTIALLNIGRGITAILIYQDGKLIFQREIPLAGQDITRAIMIMYRDEATPERMLSLEEAETLKKQIKIPLAEEPFSAPAGSSGTMENRGNVTASDEVRNQKVFQAVKGVLSAWAQDVRLTFNYFSENYDTGSIEKIYVLGGSANIGNFIEYLNQQIGIPTELLKYPEQSKITIAGKDSSEAFKNTFHEYAPALSFALKKNHESNLNYHQKRSVRTDEIIAPIFRVSLIFFSAVLLTWYAFLNIQGHYLKDTQTAMKAHGRFLQRIQSPYTEMLKWQEFLQSSDDHVWHSSHILKVLSQKTIKNILLSDISIQREGQGVTIEGLVFGDPKECAVTIAEFTRSLKESDIFRQIEVPQLDPLGADSNKGVFRITAQLTKPS